MPRNLICGVGINDASYPVQVKVSGRWAWCPFYAKWVGMILRCYSEKVHEKSPTYIGCDVCEEWLTFSNFRSWMETQNWQGKHLDKDIIIKGNKTYSPEACAFVTRKTNNFINSKDSSRGAYPIGVYWNKERGVFKSQCGNPFTGKQEYLGCFKCSSDAAIAWRERKHFLSCKLAEDQDDERVAAALRVMYL